MKRHKIVNFGLLGLGKLGTGFYKIWEEKKQNILEETGFDLRLKKILIKNDRFKRDSKIDKSLLTTDINDITNDKSIMMVVDAIGGIEPTFTLIKKIVASKKHLVSANRSLLAAKMHELADMANENKVYIQPEPALGGGVPIISALQRDLLANNIKVLVGILSGTSNFILSEMTRREISLEEALKYQEIQNLGESLSIIDYEGSDAAQKVSILAASSFGIDVNYLHVHAEGISDVSAFDLRSAREFGYEIKFLAILRNHKESFEIHVHPTFVPIDHPLTLVRGEYTAFFIDTDLLGDYMLYGKGVGMKATSSILLRDIVAIANLVIHSPRKENYTLDWNEKPVLDMDDITSGYYIRFPCLDRPGVIGEITSILGQFGINIDSAHAEVNREISTDIGFVHILIQEAKESKIKDALREIKASNLIRDRIKFYRIL